MKRNLLKRQDKSVDRTLLFLTLGLTVLGLIAVADASAPQALASFNDKFFLAKQQAVWAGIGIVAMLVVSRIHYSFWEKIALPLFIFGVVSLVAVLIPGVGSRLLGARRWIFLGPLTFQPSEFIKLALAIYLAKVASKTKGAFSYLIPLGIVVLLIMLEPDLGTTITVVGASLVQIFVSGISFIPLLLTGIGGGIIGALLILTSPYRKERLMTYLSISEDPLGRSYHIRQVLLALGSGGLFGVGLGQSRQKFLFLPESSTDSIFAVIAEEVGFIGASVLIFLFVFFIYKCLAISRSAPDKFSQFLALGIVSWIGVQIILNVSSMVALVPLTGVPLPFFSYGGSNLVMILVASGILLNISKYAGRK